MVTPAVTSDAPAASTQAPPATTHTDGGAARGERGNGSDDSGEGGRDNGNGSPNGNNSGGDHEGDAPGGNTKRGGDDESKREGDDADNPRRGGDDESKRDGGDDEGISTRGDGEEGDVQDQTAQDAPPANAPGTQALQPGKVATHLTLDEVASHVKQGHLPTCRVGPSGYGNLCPTTRTIPPRHIEDGPSFIVGVPADARTLREGAFVQDGYGRTESLMMFNGLSNRDLESLVDLVGDRAEVHELVLRPYLTEERPDAPSMEVLLGSLVVRREVASIGAHLPLYGISQRLFIHALASPSGA
jgi:hypothetical protein